MSDLISLDMFRTSKSVQTPIDVSFKQDEEKKRDDNYVCPGCRWYPRLQLYKGKHFTYDPRTNEARSYSWWSMLTVIGTKLVINACRYSNQTAKDFQRLRDCMQREGVRPDYSIYAPRGLNNLESATVYYTARITQLTGEINTPRSHARKNRERAADIRKCRAMLQLVARLRKAQTK